MAELAADEVTHPLDVFPELVWEKLFTKIKNPEDIQNICLASAYFDLLMTENGRKGKAQFGMIYPLIRRYLGPELELLTRDFSYTQTSLFVERAKSYQEALDEGEFGKLREVCPYWRKVVWKDALRRLKMKYKMFPYPPDFPTISGLFRYLILTRADGKTQEEVWRTVRRMLYQARHYTAVNFQHAKYVSTIYYNPGKGVTVKFELYKNPENLPEIKDLILSGMVTNFRLLM